MQNKITRKDFINNLTAAVAGIALAVPGAASGNQSLREEWTFVSIPDFLNVDVNYPEPDWDDALNYTLSRIKDEKPEFVLVAGDLVMGRWWRNKEQIKYMADIYYTAWKKRMDQHGLTYYVAVGDHEVGDNPWLPNGKKDNRIMGTWDSAPIEFIPDYEKAFVEHFQMPANGPDSKKRLDYYVEQGNTLIVTLNVFDQELLAQHGQADVTEDQLEWIDSLLNRMKEKTFKVVQAHTPILGPVRKESSSGLMLKDGRDSKLWQLMRKHNVDLYLCGEVHAMTAIERDGIQQVAHGSLFGYNKMVNYLVATVTQDETHLELKEIETILDGRWLPQSAGNEPREIVRIAPETKKEGFKTVGSMTLRKKGNEKQFLNKTGYFDESDNPV